ncbi:MAG: roadblock/LC7 domain-containing protein, partial [Calditerrivibrio sp.]|nr:roadblock/LC7 domain-containing protein [Calditerrivibrio sp.]
MDSVNGIKMIAIFDRDGFVIEKIDNEGTADEISAEFSSMVKYFRSISSILSVANMQTFSFEGEQQKFFLKKLTDEYYIVVSMDNIALLGKLKYVLDLLNEDILREF